MEKLANLLFHIKYNATEFTIALITNNTTDIIPYCLLNLIIYSYLYANKSSTTQTYL